MNEHDATEIAFKNGYEKAMREIFPCKIGDTVWAIRDYKGTKIPQRGLVSEMFYVGEEMKLCIVVKHIAIGYWGEKVFATHEEAERRVKEWQTKR